MLYLLCYKAVVGGHTPWGICNAALRGRGVGVRAWTRE